MEAFMLIFAVVGTLGIFSTTDAGREILKKIGLRDRVPNAAPTEDVEYLLAACDGDRQAVERRLALERERLPDLTEAEHYRRAIRKVVSEKATSHTSEETNSQDA